MGNYRRQLGLQVRGHLCISLHLDFSSARKVIIVITYKLMEGPGDPVHGLLQQLSLLPIQFCPGGLFTHG